jgi:ABC-type dipeptide/oligopeptide/nickel transport system permease component
MQHIVVRLLHSALTLWAVFTAVFFILRLLPGDAITTALFDSGASPEVIAERQRRLGLDQHPVVQYAQALTGLITGDLGISLQDGQPVIDRIRSQIGATLELASLALLIGAAAGLSLGTAAAGTSILAHAVRIGINLILSIPIFWAGTLAILVFSVWLGWLPSSGNGGLRHALLPAFVLGISGAGPIAQVLHQAIAGTRHEPFLLAAAARGIPDRQIFIRHHLRIAVLPAVSVLGLQAGYVLGGTVITEALFTRPGLGRLLYDAVLRQDYPVVQGIVLWMGLIYLVMRFTVQQVSAVLDPRLRMVE